MHETFARYQEEPYFDLKMGFQWSQRSHYIKSCPRRSQKYLSTPCTHRFLLVWERGEGKSIPSRSHHISTSCWVFCKLVEFSGTSFWLVGNVLNSIFLFVLYIHKKHQSSRSLGTLKAGEKGHHGKSELVPSNHVSRISNKLSPIVGNIWTGLCCPQKERFRV